MFYSFFYVIILIYCYFISIGIVIYQYYDTDKNYVLFSNKLLIIIILIKYINYFL